MNSDLSKITTTPFVSWFCLSMIAVLRGVSRSHTFFSSQYCRFSRYSKFHRFVMQSDLTCLRCRMVIVLCKSYASAKSRIVFLRFDRQHVKIFSERKRRKTYDGRVLMPLFFCSRPFERQTPFEVNDITYYIYVYTHTHMRALVLSSCTRYGGVS